MSPRIEYKTTTHLPTAALTLLDWVRFSRFSFLLSHDDRTIIHRPVPNTNVDAKLIQLLSDPRSTSSKSS